MTLVARAKRHYAAVLDVQIRHGYLGFSTAAHEVASPTFKRQFLMQFRHKKVHRKSAGISLKIDCGLGGFIL